MNSYKDSFYTIKALPNLSPQSQVLRELTLYEVFRRSNDVMFFCDKEGTILDVNNAFLQTYGYSREEVIGNSPRILRSRHTTNDFYQRMWGDIMDPDKGLWRGEIINRAKDGTEIPMILTITTVKNGSGDIIGYVSNAMNIAEHKSMESRLAHSEALANLGSMAAIVAHEIRNPLSSIVMAAKQLAEGSLAKADHDMVLDILRRESQRLNETLGNFLAYARPRALQLAPVDLNSLVEEVYRMVQSDRELLGRVNFSIFLDKGLEIFPMDANQLRQVVWNILINALQALKGEGELKISTGRSLGSVFVSVEDTGPGIEPAVLRDMFKPFFTTKQKGTGLGLAIAERIVKAHGGRIEACNREGRGAQFAVYLPVAR